MGGIVAADTLQLIASDQVVNEGPDAEPVSPVANTLLFPSILAVLAFDTPYLGVSPGVFAHGAEGHYNTVSSALTQLSGITGAIWGSNAATAAQKSNKKQPIAALPAPPASTSTSPWQKWGNIAMYAGAAGALAAGGTAAYMKRETITEGWSWVGSHLEFVGCLVKGEELKKRVAQTIRLNHERQIGWVNIYTRLGKRAANKDGSIAGAVVGNQRTFCNLPKTEAARVYFREAINDAAKDEISAHVCKSFPCLECFGVNLRSHVLPRQ